MSIMGIGTNLLGYGHPEVDAAVAATVVAGNMSTLNCPRRFCLLNDWFPYILGPRWSASPVAEAKPMPSLFVLPVRPTATLSRSAAITVGTTGIWLPTCRLIRAREHYFQDSSRMVFLRLWLELCSRLVSIAWIN